MSAASAAREAATKASSPFSVAWTAVKAVFSHAGEAAKATAKGVGNSVKAADQYVATRIKDDKGVWGAVKGIASDHPVYATVAGAGLTYGAYKATKAVFGPATERLKREREESSERER